MFLGIDIGTSSVKAVLCAEEGVVAEAAVPLETQNPRPGWSEQDPEAWWRAVETAVGRLPGREAVRGIGLSGQMHGAVCLDDSGQVVRPAILWNDGRAAAQAARLAAHPDVARRAGVVPLAGMTAPKIMWLKEAEPASYAWIATVLSVKDWIGLRLHGEFATDTSDAAGTLWFDQARRAWSPRLAEASDTDPSWLPPVLDGPSEAGRLTRRAAAALGMAPGTPVVAGAGDTVAGAIGMGAVRPGRAIFGLGTSGQIVTVDGKYRPSPEKMIHSFAFALPGLWYRMAAMLNGARPMAWFAAVAGVPVGELAARAATVPPEAAPLFLPYLTGERTPHGDPSVRGAFVGLGDATDAAAMMRGVIEAVAYSFADARDALGTRLAPPLVVGGGASSDVLMQTLADVLGVPVARPAAAARGAAQGAARLAAHGLGALSAEDLARPPPIEKRFNPDLTQLPRHLDRLGRYRALYRAVKGI